MLLRPISCLHTLGRHTHRKLVASMQYTTGASLQPKISKGEDEERVTGELQQLVNNGWKLNEEQIELEKTYYFKTYTKVLDFHTTIGIECKAKNHHPTMLTKFSSLTVNWTTHNPRGLSTKDTSMANYCDERAERIGTVTQSETQKCGPSSS